MYYTHVDHAYKDLITAVLESGTRKENRTGVDTLSTFNYNYTLDLSYGFPMLTTKKISWKNIVVELLWFLSGEKDIRLLKKHNCKFWDAWADENGFVPSAYGNFWNSFPVHSDKGETDYNNQLRFIENTLKNNPMSRRMVVSAWAPDNAQTSALPPCHCMFIFNVQMQDNNPVLCCHLTQRSADVGLGVPYNIASYALLTHLFARFSGLDVGLFGHTMIDAHIYIDKPDGSMPTRPDGTTYSQNANHIPGLQEQLLRVPRVMPDLIIRDDVRCLDDVRGILECDTQEILDIFKLEDYNPHPNLKLEAAI